jgi:hypothetical protein
MASPYPVGDFHLLFFASFPGALRSGSIASFWSLADYFRHLETDIVRAGRHVSEVPRTDIGAWMHEVLNDPFK